jgi:hypothetical protein
MVGWFISEIFRFPFFFARTTCMDGYGFVWLVLSVDPLLWLAIPCALLRTRPSNFRPLA